MESQQPHSQSANSESARNQLQELGITPAEYDAKVFTAVENKDTQLLSLLIAAGADVNKTYKYGKKYGITPLHWAAENGHTECVEMLIAAGADVNTADIDGLV